MSIRVGITDDHRVVLEGVRSLVAAQPDMEVAFSAVSVAETLAALQTLETDVLLLDIQLTDGDGMELCKNLRQQYPALKIIALTSFVQGAFVKRMMQNGANGYLLKNVPGTELVDTIRRVKMGETVLQEEVRNQLLQESLGTAPATHELIPTLTRREREILTLIADELTSQEIADRLSVTVSTVETHRMNLIQKFGVKNMAGLIREAIRKGLLQP